ncbi:MAG TPA: GH92 family glycosyl hydrolase [Candidatus Acidoferrales bacterium]|nr:GH92 family glycosyl hydrolase [Candidatus Acidoferrales bacterium]
MLRKSTICAVTFLFFLCASLFCIHGTRAAAPAPKTTPAPPPPSFSPAAGVLPLVGTGKGPGDSINLFPGPSMPFGMVQLSPDTESRGYGYHYYQNAIQGFSMTHMSGPGCPNEGDVFFTATTGAVHTQVPDFQSPYFHNQEDAAPGYYSVVLTRWGVHAELTATGRTGIAQFTFPSGRPANILIPISHTLNHTDAANLKIVGDREITGSVTDEVFCGAKHPYTVYFVMQFDQPFSSFGAWSGSGKPAAGVRTQDQTGHSQWIGAYATWPASGRQRVVTAKIGISYVDLNGAENNLKQEASGKSFSDIRHASYEAWNEALSVIQVSGGTPEQQKVFYTALYHSLLMPSIFSDADGRYLGFDAKIHQVAPGHLIYANFSGWDIYRSEMPLLALIVPQRVADMCQSIVLMYQQGGWIDRWPHINQYTNVMAGSPLTIIMANAWLDGIHDFDMKSGWEGMFKDATEAPPPHRPYQGQEGIQWINKVHYVPNDKVKYGSVSQIQEDCIAYASLYYLAKALGKTSDARLFYDRALYYRNVFNAQDGFFRPRNADGSWVPNFNPDQPDHGFIEGSGWHYQWLEPSDLAWAIHAVGVDRFNGRLENFFAYKKPGWYGQYYNPYNETDLEAPFEFNFSGKPWRTQEVVRRALRENYTTAADGIPGNDDCGEMSSWAVLSMMGIYTVDPASTAYELVSPVFDRVVVHLSEPYDGKTITIDASGNSATNDYIQAVDLNGKALGKNWVGFEQLTAGGSLRFHLGSQPNRSWGAAPEDAPPSLSEIKQARRL